MIKRYVYGTCLLVIVLQSSLFAGEVNASEERTVTATQDDAAEETRNTSPANHRAPVQTKSISKIGSSVDTIGSHVELPRGAGPGNGEGDTTVPVQDSAALSDSSSARLVHYNRRDVVRVNTRIRFTTLIVLPEEERVLDFICGDKEYWDVDGVENFAYVKPARAGAETNVNLITASGNVYSFFLQEISERKDEKPDLKLFVEPQDRSMVSSASSEPRFVPRDQIDDYRRQVEIAVEESRRAKETAQKRIDREIEDFRSSYPLDLDFSYRFRVDEKPFHVRAIYNDGRFTYIQANPQEMPSLYEVRDGKPNLVHFDYQDGVYIVSKVLESGYLAIGKERINFYRKE